MQCMRQMRIVLTVTLTLATFGCADHARPRSAGPAGTPQVGWVIMSGDRDNPDQDFVCQSLPRSECVVPMSRAGAQVFSHVHIYYHPAATETKYTGSIQIGFFEGTGEHEFRPDVTVKPGGPAGNQSVVGIVTGKPGTSSLTIAVIAMSPQTGATQEMRDQVRVTVR